MQDTFYITEEILLRTHTSPVQARAMDAHDFSKGPLKMTRQGVCSVVIRTMRLTVTSSTKSKAWLLGRTFLWQIFKEPCSWLSKKCSVKSVKSVCVHPTSHSQSHLLRWMFLASSVVEKAVTYVRKQVGSKLWGPVWFTTCPWNEWYRCDCLLWICLWSWTRACSYAPLWNQRYPWILPRRCPLLRTV